MSRATVRWHAQADEDLAQIWLAAESADEITRAGYEIQELLRVDPAAKGRPHALIELSEAQIAELQERAGVLPENLRCVHCGPLKAYYLAREADAMVVIYLVLRRPNP